MARLANDGVLRLDARAHAGGRIVGARGGPRASPPARGCRRRASARRRRSPAAAPRAARRACSSSAARGAMRCSSSRAPSSSRSDLRRQAPTRARPSPHAPRALPQPWRSSASTVSRASVRRRCASDSRASACRCSSSSRPIDACRLGATRLERRALFLGLPPLERDHLRLARQPRGLLGGARDLRLVADDRHLLAVLLGGQRGNRGRGLRDRQLELGWPPSSDAQELSRSAATRSRSSLISRLVARMPRDSTLAPPDTRCGPRSTSPSSVATGARRLPRHRDRLVEASRRRTPRAPPSGSSPTCGPVIRSTSDDRNDAGHPQRLARVVAVRPRIDDDEAAAAGVVLAHERQAGRRLVVALDDDVLQQVAEAGLDGALVAAVDVEVVGDGALLADVSVGLHEHHPRGVAELAARLALELLERRQARLDAGQLLLARRARSRSSASCSARAAASSDLARRALELHRVERRLRARQRVAPPPRARRRPSRLRGAGRPARHRASPASRPRARAARAACSIACRSAVAAFSAANTSLRAASTSPSSPSICRCARACASVASASDRCGLVARALGLGGSLRGATRARCAPARAAPRGRRSSLGDLRGPRRPASRPGARLNSCCCCRRLMSSSRACASSRIRAARLSASACSMRRRAEVRFHLRDAGRRRRLALARLGQPRPRRLDALRQLAVPAREQHLLPAPQLLAQPLVAARLRRLALQRAALLLDLEDDVVDAGEVLLRRLELQLGGRAGATCTW